MNTTPMVRYWLSDLAASFGDGLRFAVFPLLAAGITRSAVGVAAAVSIQGLPWLALGPVVGVLLDRHDLRRTMMLVQALQGVVVAGLIVAVAAHLDDLSVLYGAAFVTGTAATIRSAATQAGTPRIVDDDDLDRANSRLVAGELMGFELAGPAAAGWLFGVAAALPLAVNFSGITIAILLLATLPSVFRPLPRSDDRTWRRRTAGELTKGIAWLTRDPVIRGLVAVIAVVAVIDASWFAVLVLYVTRVLREGSDDYGVLLALGGVGGVLASVACGRFARRADGRRVLAVLVAVMAGSQLVLGLTAQVELAAGMLMLSSAAWAAFNIIAVGLRQRRVPSPLLGRVTSIFLAVGGGAEAVGALLGGLLAQSAGVRAPMLIGAVPLLAVTALLLTRVTSGPAQSAH